MSASCRVAVLASGAGSNLSAVLDACELPDYPAEVVLVVSNRRRCGALDIARSRDVEALSLPVADHGDDAVARDHAMVRALRTAHVKLVVCAGYDRVLSDEVLAAFPNAILNIHPSLLPAFGGEQVHRAAADLDAGGMTAVEQALAAGAIDGGPIVLQAAVEVYDEDNADSLR